MLDIYVFMTIGNMCWICYIGHINIFVFDFLWKGTDIRKKKFKWSNIVTLPSAGRWQRASAGRWQRGHVSSTYKIWADLFGLFAICQQMAKLFAICWQTANSLQPLPSAGRRQSVQSVQIHLCHWFTVCSNGKSPSLPSLSLIYSMFSNSYSYV